MKKLFYSFFTMLAVATLLYSCGEDDPAPPIVDMFAEVDENNSYKVNFTTNAQNATSFTWDFGDGNSGSGSSVSHTYVQSGDYMVKVTALGEGGEAIASKSVTIAASMSELISGGPAATNGKTWILSRTATPGVDGAGPFDSSYPADLMPGTDNLLDQIGLGAEYDNEYTFFHDGSYSVDNKDGNNLAGWVYSAVQVGMENVVTQTPVGIFSVTITPPSDATWSLTENANISVDAVDEGENGEFTPKTVDFEGIDYLTFGNGGFIGIQDFAVNAIIRDITADRMVVAVYMHSVMAAMDKPSHLITISFDAK